MEHKKRIYDCDYKGHSHKYVPIERVVYLYYFHALMTYFVIFVHM